MQVRADLTQTLLAVYTLKDFTGKKQTMSINSMLKLVANPTGSLTAVVVTEFADFLYDVVGKTVKIDKLLRATLLPPARLLKTLSVLHTILNGISARCPTIMRPIFPVHILCKDSALLVSHARHALSVGVKIKACITKTGTIANETFVAETTRHLRDSMESKIKSTATAILPSTAPAPVNPAANWGGAVWSFATQVVKVGSAILVDEGAKLASDKLTHAAKMQAEECINACTTQLNAQVEKKEHDYLNKVSEVVVNTTAKKALTMCLSIGAGYLTAAYLVPNVTKWGLSCVMGDAAAEVLTTGVNVLTTGFTVFGLYSTVCQYGSNRQQNHENYAVKLDEVQTSVIEVLSSKMEAGLTNLPSIDNRFVLFGQEKFVERCKAELPQTFKTAGI
jgi:hypothetical protein